MTVLALLLALWLILGFWPLSVANRWVLSLLAVAAASLALWHHLHSRRDVLSHFSSEGLPPEDFPGSVLLVVGDETAWFEHQQIFRETPSGWYMRVNTPEQLLARVEQLVTMRPALRPRVAVMLSLMPEKHTSDNAFFQWLRTWHRAVVQCRPWLSSLPPILLTLLVSGPLQLSKSVEGNPARWFTLTPELPGIRVRLPGLAALPVSDWLRESGVDNRLARLSETLWLNALQSWFGKVAGTFTNPRQGDLPALRLASVGFCLTPIAAHNDNLWQQHLAALTALPPPAGSQTPVLPLPDILLTGLSHRRGLSRSQQLCRQAGLMAGVFLLLAMLASFINNQRLLRSVGDHLALYYRLEGHTSMPEAHALQRLKADSRLLDDWLRRGTPLRYGLGLYQGQRLAPTIEGALSERTSQPPARTLIQKVVREPTTIRLDSLSLFDSGNAALKPGSIKVLVNTLLGIKAKPGWLIVVSGHTDNTGSPRLNQDLSQQRAEAVRNWIRDTGDVPESCFAVQGYGESRPIATNSTEAGRLLNRRVEISLVPQADACRLPGVPSAPPRNGGVSHNEKE